MRRIAGSIAVLAAIGGSVLAASAQATPTAGAASKGTVSALFAGSLVDYMEYDFGPSFQKAGSATPSRASAADRPKSPRRSRAGCARAMCS